MNVAIREIDRFDDFLDLAPRWDALLARSACPSMFLSSAWLSAWWRAFGAGQNLRIVCVYSDGELLAAAPLCARRARYYGVRLKETCFLGDHTSDRQDLLCDTETPAVLADLWHHLRTHPRGCDILRLEEIPAGSPALAAGRAAWPALEVENSSLLPFLKIDRTWPDYEATLTSKFRSDLRTRHKKFAQWGQWKLEVIQGASIADHLDGIVAVERASHKPGRGAAFFLQADNVAFFSNLLASSGDIEPVLLSLTVDGRMIGYAMGWVYGGSFHGYNTAFDQHYTDGSVGKWLIHRTIEYAHERGLSGFEFLRGASAMKHRWNPQDTQNVRAVGFQPLPVPQLLRFAVFRARPWIKRRRRSGVGADHS